MTLADGSCAGILFRAFIIPCPHFPFFIVAYLPVPDLFNQGLSVMGRFLPADTMGLVRKILADVISPNRGAFLSFGLLGILWTASGGFAAAIEALNMAYDVEDDRPFWKTRPLAVALAFVTGSLLLVALSVLIAGPKFGGWLASKVHLSGVFVILWPYFHWTIAIVFTVLAVRLSIFLLRTSSSVFSPLCPARFLPWAAGSACHICWEYISDTSPILIDYGTMEPS